MSVFLSDEDENFPLSPKSKEMKILQKKREKKKQILISKGVYISQKKKIIKKILKENGEYEEFVEEISDYEGGEQTFIYDKKGELVSEDFKTNKETIKNKQTMNEKYKKLLKQELITQ